MLIKRSKKILLISFMITLALLIANIYVKYSVEKDNQKSYLYFESKFKLMSVRYKNLSKWEIIDKLDKVEYKEIMVDGCREEYPQSKKDFIHRNYWTGYHGGSNEFHFYWASLNICNCICQNELLAKPSSRSFMKDYLLTDTMRLFYYYDNYLQENIFQDIDSVVKYSTIIFKNDKKMLELISAYNKSEDTLMTNKILKPFYIIAPCEYKNYLSRYVIHPDFIDISNLLDLIEALNYIGLYEIYGMMFFDFGLI